jgi:GNAT superfamily N-acetyltransferase
VLRDDCHIRRALPEDAATIARVHIDSWRETYAGIVSTEYLKNLSYSDRAARWEDNLGTAAAGADEKPETWVLEAPVEGQGRLLSGFVTYGPARDLEFGAGGELYAIYLLRAAQGHGFGRLLLDQAAKGLKAAGFSGMSLWVLALNPTRDFYRHMGGVETGRKMINIGSQELEEISLHWTL